VQVPKLLGISGSLRRGTYNTMLVHEAARAFAPDHFQLADLNLPLYNADVEAEGLPEPVRRLCRRVEWADAILISTSEYNKGPSGVLKNALDWVSRPRPAPMAGKPAAVVSVAAGAAGGERAKSAMYIFLVPFKVRFVLHPEVNVGNAEKQFDADGRLVNEAKRAALEKLMSALKAAARA
jgi:chromate reductase, NAD(P)H dehydrogenase (quinone)